MARNPAFDVTYYCLENDWLDFNTDIDASLELVSIADANTLDFDIELFGTIVKGVAFNGTFEDSKLSLNADFYIQYQRSNWLKWSKIGEFDFTQDKTNIAGEMPLDWPGDIWHIGKLHKDIIVYGSGGITILTPVDTVFSKNTVLELGIKSKGAVLTTLHFHIFITSDGTLWRFGETLEQLGYDEFLSGVSNPIISYDSVNDLVYICNGTLGYVYNHSNRSLGKCNPKISGIVYYNGASHVLGSGTIVNPTTSIKLNPTDLNTTYFKYISSVEIGGTYNNTSLTIAYRNTSSGSFINTSAKSILPDMKVYPNIGVKEFDCSITGILDSISYIRFSGFISDFDLIGKDAYRIESSGNNLVIYTPSRIDLIGLSSSGIYTKTPILNLGLKSKGSFCKINNNHYFITTDGKLWVMSSESLKCLDYSEFLTSLTNPVMSYDPTYNNMYICSASTGYVYNVMSESLGKGPSKITGIDLQSPVTLLASAAIVAVPNYLTLNAIDFNNRNFKSISEIEVGGEFGNDLTLGISYRNDTTGDFEDPVWFSVTMEGRTFPNFFAKEFQFHLSTAENIRLDYLKVKGMFADFNPIDA